MTVRRSNNATSGKLFVEEAVVVSVMSCSNTVSAAVPVVYSSCACGSESRGLFVLCRTLFIETFNITGKESSDEKKSKEQ